MPPFLIPRKALLALATVVVAIIVIVAIVLPALPKASVLQTTIVAVDTNGVQHPLVSLNQAAIVSVNGLQVSSILITTSFTASSPNYKTYTVIPGAVPVTWGQTSAQIASAGTSWAVVLFYAQSASLIFACGFISFAQAVPASQTFNTGTTYYVGNSANLIGTTNQPTATVTSSSILGWVNTNGCPGTGYFTLSYGVQVNIQAIGTGAVPSATYAALYSVGVTVGVGTISIAGSTTGTTQ